MLHRRDFLAQAAAWTAALSGLRAYGATGLRRSSAGGALGGYGPLVPDPAGLMDLPAGFTYQVISTVGDTMSDGLLVPDRCDGMGAFAGSPGEVVLVRNHELIESEVDGGPFGSNNVMYPTVDPTRVYDKGYGTPSLGGTTTLVYDQSTGTITDQRLSLAGTLRNCSGGPTPWGTWITCEETVQGSDTLHERDHGYCFEVPAIGGAPLTMPVPLTAMGRFNHEAAAVDPITGDVYLTEDQPDSLFYRFRPSVPGELEQGGTLQALVSLEFPNLDTSNHNAATQIPQGTRLKVGWVTLPDAPPSRDTLRYVGQSVGAATFARGEGMWAASDGIYFACTDGGLQNTGQIWRYRPSYGPRPYPAGHLELYIQSDTSGPFNRCDNLTCHPTNGDLFICEDRPGLSMLIGITPAGVSFPFAQNVFDTSEFAGAAFSPDGTVLFVNLYRPGRTLAISGPF